MYKRAVCNESIGLCAVVCLSFFFFESTRNNTVVVAVGSNASRTYIHMIHILTYWLSLTAVKNFMVKSDAMFGSFTLDTPPLNAFANTRLRAKSSSSNKKNEEVNEMIERKTLNIESVSGWSCACKQLIRRSCNKNWFSFQRNQLRHWRWPTIWVLCVNSDWSMQPTVSCGNDSSNRTESTATRS